MLLLREVRFAVRRLTRSPAFLATAVITIALSLSVLGALGSLWNTLILRAQPAIGASDELVRLDPVWPRREIPYATWEQYTKLSDMRPERLDIAFYVPRIRPARLGDADVGKLLVHAVSPDYFQVLRAPLLAGAGLADSSLTRRPAVISWRLWRERLGGATDVVGRSLVIGPETTYVVTGIAAPRFHGPEGLQQADIWVLYGRDTRWSWGRMLGRLKNADDTALDAAQAELSALWTRIHSHSPGGVADTSWARSRVEVSSLAGGLHRENHRTMALLVGGVATLCLLTLLIATANLASLILTRAVARERDFAVKRAMGAGLPQLIREPIAEVFVLFLGASIVGALLARPTGTGLVSALNAPFPFVAEVSWDLPTMGMTAAVGFTAALLCAVVPVARLAGTDPAAALRDDAGGAHIGRSGRRLQNAFLAVQLLFAFVLIGGSATVILRSARQVGLDVGVPEAERLALVGTPLSSTAPDARLIRRQYTDRLTAELSPFAVATALAGPAQNRLLRTTLRDGSGASHAVQVNVVSPNYLQVAGARLHSGLDSRAVGDGANVTVLSRSAAQRLGIAAASGQRIRIGEGPAFDAAVIGVADDIVYDLSERSANVVYVLADQFDPVLGRETALVRFQGNHATLARFDSTVRRLAPQAAARSTQTVADLVADHTRGQRALLALIGVCAAMALLIAVIGVFGTVAYTVHLQRRETAIRLALGATAAGVIGMYSWHSVRLAMAGLAPGLLVLGAASMALISTLGPLMDYFVFALAIAAGVLLLSTILATVIAVRVTALFNPATLLRSG